MVAYPFNKAPTLDEFIARVQKDFGAVVKFTQGEIGGPGNPNKPRYIERIVKGQRYRAVIQPGLNGAEGLTPDHVRSLCDRLKISPSIFGMVLTLGGMEETEDD